jgi:type I restriction enzyme, S subunit
LLEGWVWCRLREVTEIIMGQSPDGNTYNSDEIGIPLIDVPVEFGGMKPFDKTILSKYITELTKICNEGDLLICVRGSTTGRTYIADFQACIGRGVVAIRPIFYDKIIYNIIILARDVIFKLGTGSTFPNISQEDLKTILIGFSPIEEQRKIAESLDK